MIGLGLMGSAMAASLLKAGHPVLGYDVVAARRATHRRVGGRVATSAGAVAAEADVIVTSLPSVAALEETAVLLARAPDRRRVVIETSTLPIAAKKAARAQLARRGAVLLDCPLSGTAAQVRAKDVVVYASGPRAAYRRVAPILDAFSRAHYFVGPFGDGSKMKFVANLLVAIHNVAAAEAMVLGMRAGLDPALMLKVIGDGAGSSRMLQVRGPMMVAGRYGDATMKVDVFQKDIAIIGEFARAVASPTPLFAASAPFYTAAVAMGRGQDDTAAVCAVLETMAGHVRPQTPTSSGRRRAGSTGSRSGPKAAGSRRQGAT
jgi:L-threonate 2-dehydrogenase